MTAATNPVYSPRFELDVGGTTYQETGGRVGNLTVETTVDGADMCRFTLNYPYDPEHQDFDELDWGAIDPGTEVEASVGWGGEGTVEPVFVGTSQSVSVDFSPEGGQTVDVTAYGVLHEMMQGVVERSWSETTVVDVAKEVLNEYFSTVEVDGNGSERNRIIQHGQNDYRFVRQLADDYGFEFYAERDTAYFTQRSSLKDDPELTLTYGNTLDTFAAEISEADLVETVEVRYWDMSTEKEIVGEASNQTGEGKEVFRVTCDSQEEADDIAKSRLDALSMARATGYGETDGIPDLTAGTVIEIQDLGDRFDRSYYVTRAAHRLSTAGYRTAFDVKELPE